jgi:hypothetical protein
MSHDHPGDHPFTVDNHAYQRLRTVLEEHFDVIVWGQRDDRPVMATLSDIGTGDAMTIAFIDTFEMRDPHCLVVADQHCAVVAHGPCPGLYAAASLAPQVALSDPATFYTQPLPLRPPDADRGELAWRQAGGFFIDKAHHAHGSGRGLAVLLIEAARRQIAAVGPFATWDAAETWAQKATGDTVRAVTLLLRPPQPTPAG